MSVTDNPIALVAEADLDLLKTFDTLCVTASHHSFVTKFRFWVDCVVSLFALICILRASLDEIVSASFSSFLSRAIKRC